jgi:RNA-binding protein 39
LLKNLFDPGEETDPEWWLDIAEDVKGECEKFGGITHTYVDKDSQGFVYLRFVDEASCTRAQSALHARWFAGRKIAAEYQFKEIYDGHFGLQKK